MATSLNSTAAYLERVATPKTTRAHEGEFHSFTATGNITLDNTYPEILKIDPGGSSRDVTLEAEANSAGLKREFINAADASENLVIKDDGGSTICTINQNEKARVYCDGSAWELLCVETIALS